MILSAFFVVLPHARLKQHEFSSLRQSDCIDLEGYFHFTRRIHHLDKCHRFMYPEFCSKAIFSSGFSVKFCFVELYYLFGPLKVNVGLSNSPVMIAHFSGL